jgi:hypothetical protein
LIPGDGYEQPVVSIPKEKAHEFALGLDRTV